MPVVNCTKQYKEREKHAVLDSNWKVICNFLNFVLIIFIFLITGPPFCLFPQTRLHVSFKTSFNADQYLMIIYYLYFTALCLWRKKKKTGTESTLKRFLFKSNFPFFRKTGAEAANSSALWRQQNIHLVPQTSTQWSRSACAVRLARAHKHTIKTQIKSGMKGWLHRERQREHSVRRSIEQVGCGEGCRTFYWLQTIWCLQNNHSQVASEPDRSERCIFHTKVLQNPKALL